MKIDFTMTHISHAEDLPFLRKPLFDVNMRLYRCSGNYLELIQHCCAVIDAAAQTKFEDYKKPHGTSGANLGIPFNIIAIVRNRGQEDEYVETMINPKITRKYGEVVSRQSNCGSIRLKEQITIERPSLIDFEYYDQQGEWKRLEGVGPEEGSLTIQHEVDHNLGILITDYVK